jgi:hypothetical protein
VHFVSCAAIWEKSVFREDSAFFDRYENYRS